MNHEEATLNGKNYEEKVFPLIWSIMFPNTVLAESNPYQNMRCHYDYWWRCLNKGRWRIYKLEIKYKIKGWGLGEADLIIFGAEDGVYVVNRAKVTAYICKS